MRSSAVYHGHILFMNSGTSVKHDDGVWRPARPLGMIGLKYRISNAWKVLKGEADIIVWD